jgi:hypothetical protein
MEGDALAAAAQAQHRLSQWRWRRLSPAHAKSGKWAREALGACVGGPCRAGTTGGREGAIH